MTELALLGLPNEGIKTTIDGRGRYYYCVLNGWRVVVYPTEPSGYSQYRIELFDEDAPHTWDTLYEAIRPRHRCYIDQDNLLLLAALPLYTSDGYREKDE